MINQGIARLEVAYDGEVSTVVDQFSQTPLQLHKPLYLEESSYPTVYLKTPSSGLLGGDDHKINVIVGKNSQLELRTQAATLAYPGESSLSINLDVSDGGRLLFLPHALILGADSALNQKVRITLHGSAAIDYSDTWCAGRIAMQEQWKFESFDYSLEIIRNDELVYREKWKIAPASANLQHNLLCGDYTHFSSLYSFGSSSGEPALKQSLPSNHWEFDQNWVLSRDGGTICRRCSKVNPSVLNYSA